MDCVVLMLPIVKCLIEKSYGIEELVGWVGVMFISVLWPRVVEKVGSD